MQPALDEESLSDADRSQIMTALFKQLVMQQTSMALMFLGKIPHPETEEILDDLESAKLYVDQLEMLREKTRGNLNDEESQLLDRSLTAARSALIEKLDDHAD